MADRVLRFPLRKPPDFINFPNFSNPLPWRLPNPRFAPSHSRLLHCSSATVVLLIPVKLPPPARRSFSYGSGSGDGDAAGDEDDGGGYERRERRSWRRRRKPRWRLEELLEDGFDDVDDDDVSDDGDSWRFVGEVIDNVWIFKTFKSLGYLLPFIIISFLSATGPKAFLTALGVAAGPSLVFLAFQKLSARDNRRRKSRTSKLGPAEEEEEEEEEEKRRNTKVRYYSSRFGNNGTPVKRGDGGPAGVTTSSSFGGWDELDSIRPDSKPSQMKNEPTRKPVGNGSIGYKGARRVQAEPLLLRFLVSLFPFLSS